MWKSCEGKKELLKKIYLYKTNKTKCIEDYGEPNSWDVSKVTDMGMLFCKSSFGADISNWDVSNVTNMSDMYVDLVATLVTGMFLM